jgi:cytochrome c oxidase cbb3-type subunit 3/ubiquinol-cytochrome c reductase cytochrome c subunit
VACTGCGRWPGKPTKAEVPLTPRQVRDFALLYSDNCAGCHGPEGKGNCALALANPVYLAIADDDTLRRVTTRGVKGTLMPPFAKSAGGELTDEQIDILVKGIRTRWAKADALAGTTPLPYAPKTVGDPKRGAEVYTTFCVSCHGPNGRGTEKAGSIVDNSYLALVSDQSLRSTVIAGRPELGHPDWRNCVPGQAMTSAEVTDVVAWLSAQRTSTPGQPYPIEQESQTQTAEKTYVRTKPD